MDNFCPCLTFKYKYCLSFAYDDRDQKSKKIIKKKCTALFPYRGSLCDKYFVIKVKVLVTKSKIVRICK